jgi:sec-independent protein translocase protein TatB
MFNVGGPEIMVVLLVALIVLGPEQLPKAMRTVGNVMAQIRKVSNGFQDEMRSAMNTLDDTSSAKQGTGTATSAPSSGSGSTAIDPGVTEVVARNDAAPVPADGANGQAPEPAPAPLPDPAADRPGTSAADRAAG